MPNSASASAGTGHDLHADHAARDLAGAQLRDQLADAVDRNREADADVALLARVRVDRGVDADDFAARVQQRTAGVAGIDRRVGLQHVGEALFGDRERARRRADHADAHGVREAERIADRHHPVARLHLRRVAELHFDQVALRLVDQLDQRAVGQRIAADDLGLVVDVVFFAEEVDFDLGRAFDDVIVGEDVAVLADDEAGAGGLRFLFARTLLRRWPRRPWPPKKRSSRSSLPPPPPPKNSVISWARCFEVLRMFTTAGDIALAMLRNVPASTGPLSGALFIGGARRRSSGPTRRASGPAGRQSPSRRPARPP